MLTGQNTTKFQSTPLMRGETSLVLSSRKPEAFQSTPLMRGETRRRSSAFWCSRISIHSPHARGDSINLQKSFWIQGSLYNKNITAHFSKTLKPFYGLKSSCFGCEASRKVMTASPSHGFSEDASHHSMI